MKHSNRAPLSPAEYQRAEYRQHVMHSLRSSGEPLSDGAAIVADVLADTTQGVMFAPRSTIARAYFDVHAEDLGAPAFTRESLAAALEELAERGMLPSWCRLDRTVSEAVAR